jgi:hypothetical protein
VAKHILETTDVIVEPANTLQHENILANEFKLYRALAARLPGLLELN